MRIYKKYCAWCGSAFYGNKQKTYCTPECREAVERARSEAKNHGRDFRTDVILEQHRKESSKKQLNFRTENKMVAVHVSSSAMYWKAIPVKILVKE